jgi:hypothetical protein
VDRRGAVDDTQRRFVGHPAGDEEVPVVAVLTVLVIVTLSLLVTRVATAALTLTGLSRESARFQARSALTTTGFTTVESERIVRHPVRRRVVMTLMLMGQAGIVTVIATLALSFATTGGARDMVMRLVLLLGGLVVLYVLARSQRFDRLIQPLIRRLLRRFTDLDVRDYASLLHIHGEFAVSELAVEEGDWLAGRLLQEVRPADEGLLILGVQRDATTYFGAPTGATRIRPGDTLIVYGPTHRLSELDRRGGGPSGDVAHVRAMREALAERARSGDDSDDGSALTVNGQGLDDQYVEGDRGREVLAPTEDVSEATGPSDQDRGSNS